MAIFAALLEVVRSSDIDSAVVMSLAMYFTLLCACIVVGHLLEENRWANESIIALLIGLGTGLLMLLISKGKSSKILTFDNDLFFIFLLPPIIFNAGFQVKKKQFFHNFSTILLFAVIGTMISFCLISLGAFLVFKRLGLSHLSSTDFLAIGAILSATDSVCTLQILNQEETPFLYSIVFGEGVVNDATSIVLFNSVQALDFSNITASTALTFFGTFLYLFFTSTLLGIAMGLVSAFVIKKLYFGRHSTDREIAIMMLMAYLSYMIAQLLDLSGILTIFFCGIVMAHYTWHNTTESSRITTKHSFATISFIAETFIFLYVGMDALDADKWKFSEASVGTSVAISSTMLLLVLVGRAAFVFPLANIANLFKTGKDNKIELRQQFIMWWAGLMRGAVTIALSYNRFSYGKQEYALMITSILIVVLFSTVVFGSITKPLIETVLLRHSIPTTFGRNDSPTLEDLRLRLIEDGAGPSDEGSSSTQLERRASSLQLLIRYPAHTVHYYWRKFDDKYMRPIFGGRGFVPGAPRTHPSPENQTF